MGFSLKKFIGKKPLDPLGSVAGPVMATMGMGDPWAENNAAEQANAANKNAAQTQMDFQERMSNSAYQRGMDDMKKAGLNPMLAYSQGGASAPSGASYTATPAPTVASGVSGAVMKGLDKVMGVAALQNQNTATQANANAANAQSAKAVAEVPRIQAETERIKIENSKNRKYQPANDFLGDMANKSTNILKKVFENMSNSSKPNVKVLGPANDKRSLDMQDKIRKMKQSRQGH